MKLIDGTLNVVAEAARKLAKVNLNNTCVGPVYQPAIPDSVRMEVEHDKQSNSSIDGGNGKA